MRSFIGQVFDGGWVTLGRWRGAPMRLHWTVLLTPLVFGGLRWLPAYWLSVLFLILLHEVGHAWWVMRFKLRVHSIDAHGFGGWCRWSGRPTALQRGLIASGGVMAQGVLLLATLAVGLVWEPTPGSWGGHVEHAFVRTNLWLIAFNLLPIPPLDGAEVWKLLRPLRNRVQFTREASGWREKLSSQDAPTAGEGRLWEPEPSASAPLKEAGPSVEQLDALEDEDIPQELKQQVAQLLAGLDGRDPTED